MINEIPTASALERVDSASDTFGRRVALDNARDARLSSFYGIVI